MSYLATIWSLVDGPLVTSEGVDLALGLLVYYLQYLRTITLQQDRVHSPLLSLFISPPLHPQAGMRA